MNPKVDALKHLYAAVNRIADGFVFCYGKIVEYRSFGDDAHTPGGAAR